MAHNFMICRTCGAEYDASSGPCWRCKDEVGLTDLSRLLEIPYSTLAQAAREGRIKTRRIGKIYLSSGAAIQEAIDEGHLRKEQGE